MKSSKSRGIQCIIMEPAARRRAGRFVRVKRTKSFFRRSRIKALRRGQSAAASLDNVLTVLSWYDKHGAGKDNVATLSDFAPLSDAEQGTLATALDIYKERTPYRVRAAATAWTVRLE